MSLPFPSKITSAPVSSIIERPCTKTLTLVTVDDALEDDGEMVELAFGDLPTGFAAGSPATARATLMNDDLSRAMSH